jgi:hypothetical protein
MLLHVFHVLVVNHGCETILAFELSCSSLSFCALANGSRRSNTGSQSPVLTRYSSTHSNGFGFIFLQPLGFLDPFFAIAIGADFLVVTTGKVLI